MKLIDTHTHLYLPQFSDDIEQVVINATKSHVAKMLLPNIDCETIAPMTDLCSRFPFICYPMLGLHPTSVAGDYLEKLEILESLAEKREFIAIGETGLDKYWDKSRTRQQEDSFRRHLHWARAMNLPVVIHSREAIEDIISILKSSGSGLRGVFHAFSGSVEQAGRIIESGFLLGIGGVVTYRNSGLETVIKSVDLESIVLETDSPFLTPVPKRGQRNESANLVYIAEKIAGIKGVPVETVAAITSSNAEELFNLENG